MLILGGGFEALQAIAAIVNDKYLVVLPNYVYAFDLTVWGWIHLLIGLALVAIGISLLMGQGWARMAGIVVAGRGRTDQLHLAALLPLVGDRADRGRRARHLGADLHPAAGEVQLNDRPAEPAPSSGVGTPATTTTPGRSWSG